MPSRDALRRVSEVLDGLKLRSLLILDDANICAYLLEHVDMLDILAKLAVVVTREFGADAQVSLERHKGREDDDDFLVIVVRPQEYRSNLLDRIEKVTQTLDEDLAAASGWIQVTTDFMKPRTADAV